MVCSFEFTNTPCESFLALSDCCLVPSMLQLTPLGAVVLSFMGLLVAYEKLELSARQVQTFCWGLRTRPRTTHTNGGRRAYAFSPPTAAEL